MTLFFRFAALSLALAIAVLSLQPATGVASVPHADKVQHLLAYGGLTGLMGLGWPKAGLLRLVLIAALFGLGIELAQGLSGLGRTLSLLDALANLLGACLAATILRFWRAPLRPNGPD